VVLLSHALAAAGESPEFFGMIMSGDDLEVRLTARLAVRLS
jgi:hypothetical protein